MKKNSLSRIISLVLCLMMVLALPGVSYAKNDNDFGALAATENEIQVEEIECPQPYSVIGNTGFKAKYVKVYPLAINSEDGIRYYLSDMVTTLYGASDTTYLSSSLDMTYVRNVKASLVDTKWQLVGWRLECVGYVDCIRDDKPIRLDYGWAGGTINTWDISAEKGKYLQLTANKIITDWTADEEAKYVGTFTYYDSLLQKQKTRDFRFYIIMMPW